MKLWEKMKKDHTEARLIKKAESKAFSDEKNTQKIASQKPQFIICGLGNPTSEYFDTRHNAGFLALDYISQKHGIKVNKKRFKALCGTGEIGGKSVLLMKPQTYMNLSGEALRDAADFYKISFENILVISDDVSFDVGYMRIRKKGSDGGQKGLRSIINHFSSEEFPRIKIGVGKKPPEYEMTDWVLGKLTDEDKKILFEVFKKASDAVEDIIKGDIENAMAKTN